MVTVREKRLGFRDIAVLKVGDWEPDIKQNVVELKLTKEYRVLRTERDIYSVRIIP